MLWLYLAGFLATLSVISTGWRFRRGLDFGLVLVLSALWPVTLLACAWTASKHRHQ